MTPKSAKAKGRRLQQETAQAVREYLDLSELDVRSNIMGNTGADLMLSSEAQKRFPFSVECKNTEKLNIWQAIEQAAANAAPGTQPLVVFSRNRSDTYAVVRLPALLGLLRKVYDGSLA